MIDLCNRLVNNELTKEERDYLQANICKVETYLDYVEEEPKDPWDD